MKEVVDLELEVFMILGLFSGGRTNHLVVSVDNQLEVCVSVEEGVLLKKHSILSLFKFIKISDGF
jgi:hypothetical protein